MLMHRAGEFLKYIHIFFPTAALSCHKIGCLVNIQQESCHVFVFLLQPPYVYYNELLLLLFPTKLVQFSQ